MQSNSDGGTSPDVRLGYSNEMMSKLIRQIWNRPGKHRGGWKQFSVKKLRMRNRRRNKAARAATAKNR